MSVANLYPNSPTNVPADLTRAKDSYKRQTTLAFVGLLAFIVIYLCLTAVFVYITVQSILFLATTGQFDFGKVFVIFCSGLLALFMIKSLFAVRKMKDPQGIEVFLRTNRSCMITCINLPMKSERRALTASS